MAEAKLATDVFELLELLQVIVPEFTGKLDPNSRDDLAQEIKLRLWARLVSSQSGKGREFALSEPVSERYIRRAAANIRKSFLTKRGRDRERLESDYRIEDAEMNPQTPGDEMPARRAVRDILQELDPDDRKILRLAFLAGKSHKEIAAKLAISEEASRSRLRRAMKKVRELARSAGLKLDDFK